LQCPTRESEGRRNEEPTADEQHGGHNTQGHCASGSWQQKASWSPGECFPSRGGARRKILVGSRERRVSNPSKDSEPATIGCSRNYRGGEPSSTLPCGVACARRREGPSLGVARLTRSVVIVSTSCRRKRGLGRCAARKRRIEGRWPSGSYLTACLQRRVAGSVDFRVTHCPLL